MARRPRHVCPKTRAVALICYGLLIVAWIIDLYTPQLFIVAILFNGPIALSSLVLRSRLTTNLVITAELANAAAGYYNGVVAGHHWDGVAVGDRLLLAASYVLVGYISVKAQEYAREAGVSMGRMRQIDVEKALRVAIGRVRGNAQRGAGAARGRARISRACWAQSKAMLILRETPFGTPLTLSYAPG